MTIIRLLKISTGRSRVTDCCIFNPQEDCCGEAIYDPEVIYQGSADELIASKEIEPGKILVVIYKELNKEDGFIITAFLTRKIKQFERRIKIWPQ